MTIQNPANNQATLAAGDCISANTATNGGCNSNVSIPQLHQSPNISTNASVTGWYSKPIWL